MSALWDKLTGHDDEQKKQEHISETRPVATEAQGHTVKESSTSGFSFSKLKDALDGDDHKGPQPIPAPVPGTTVHHDTQKKDHDWTDKFKDLLDGGASNKREAEEEKLRLEKERIAKEEEARKAEEAASWKGKLKGIFKSDEEEEEERKRLQLDAEHKRREAEKAKQKESSWSAKIKDVFDGDDEEKERERQRLAEEAKRNQSFGAKVRGIFGGEEEKKPEKEHGWFGTKFNEIAGGGQKSEAHEDKLDKAIDMYQKHVLKQGDQSNESAIEQAKDEQISDAIRKGWKGATGRDFPASDKPHQ